MSNPHGMPVWYELATADPGAAKRFYDDVLGWTVEAAPSMPGGMDYRAIEAGQDMIGGVMRLTDEMKAGGARPTWLFYVGVDDVDATVAKITEGGGKVLMPAFDLAGVGRMAFVADPQGIPFYVMRGASDRDSTAYDRMGMGKCNWNELATPDQEAALKFYGDVFGWTYPDRMAMGDMGDYVFVQVGDQVIGAIMRQNQAPAPAWQFYFRAPDIEVAAEKVKAGGGAVHMGPMEVPGGDRIIVASDLEGVMVGVVGPGEGAAA